MKQILPIGAALEQHMRRATYHGGTVIVNSSCITLIFLSLAGAG